MTKTIHLCEIPNAEARAYVATGAPVIAYFNPVEYHGPHLPLDTDTILSQGVIAETWEKLRAEGGDWPILVYSNLRIGCGAVPTNGTVHHRYADVKRMILDTCHGIRALGAKRAILATFHGEPHHNMAIDDGVNLLRSWGIASFAPMNVVMTESVELELETYAPIFATIDDEDLRKRCRDGFPADFHGGFFETSLMLHWRPEAVAANWTEVPPCPPIGTSPSFVAAARFFRARGKKKLAREIEFAHSGLEWSKLRPVTGYTGYPGLANRKAGRLFAERISDLVARAMRDYFIDSVPPPEPILKWVRKLSFDGRIG